MSFLAQLQAQQRTDRTQSNQTLKLYYLLDVKEDNSPLPILSLSLLVADDITSLALSNDSSSSRLTAKAYTPQDQHLKLPPPFIQSADITVLEQLVSNNTQHGWPELSVENDEAFWRILCGTQRLYFRHHSTSKALKVEFGENITTGLYWQQDSHGNQILTASPVLDKRLFKRNNHFNLLALNDLNNKNSLVFIASCSIVHAGQLINSEQMLAITKSLPNSTYLLKAADIPIFLQNHQSTWDQLNLPLPPLADAKLISAQLRGGLVCENTYHSGKGRDELKLDFIYITKNYCTWFSATDLDKQYVVLDDELFIIERRKDQELSFLKMLKKHCKDLSRNPNIFTSDDSDVWKRFFIYEKTLLEKNGFIFRIANSFKRHFIQADKWLTQLHQKSNGTLQVDLFVELEDNYNNKEKINLLELLDQIQRFNLGQYRDDVQLTLKDGRILLMPAQRLISLTEEFGDLLVNGRSSLNFNKHQTARLAQLENLLPAENQWQGDLEALELSRKLKRPPHIFEQRDCGVNATLRPYQWLGVCWMQHLKSCGVNGLLADDMGLGKTLQTISHLSVEYANNKDLKSSLIVVPTSLLHNWLNEFKKFAPHLNVIIHHGAQRKHCYLDAPHQIMLTSYQLVINDFEFFSQNEFSWLILDEAQNIKNPRTKTHIAIKDINASHKMCLSGTPVENNLVELWAILNFLMPTCLGSLNEFKFHYQKPIEQDGNARKMELLLNRISPFMLRRTKLAVAKDLPEKTEINQAIDLSEKQWQFYESIKNNTWQDLQLQLDGSSNAAEQQIFVLSALLKLRQACCDPLLLNESDIPSAKRQHCVEMTTELAKEGRGILIFSQFTSMLDILAEDFKNLGIDFGLLTGKTRDRQALVDRFQVGEFPVFLISLKAGGVGLNLTRADTVIHYDPWWNSAAEQQAADRAHRIGQKNKVFVYKLIANNTIEEKIAALQARKAALGQYVNQQAQQTGVKFSVGLEELLSLWQDDKENINANSNISV